jgi:Ca2+-binding EF-hand superfamily protein
MHKAMLTTFLLVMSPAIASAADDFVKIDANKDGQVTTEELTAVGIGWSTEQFATADSDGNGTLSRAEYEAAGK